MFNTVNDAVKNAHTEALVIGLFEENKVGQAVYQQLNDALDGQLDDLVKSEDVTNSYGTVSKVHTLGKIGAKRIYFVGLGKKDELDVSRFRKAMGKVFKRINRDGNNKASLAMESLTTDPVFVEAVGEAFTLSTYQLQTYHTSKKDDAQLTNLDLITTEASLLESLHVGYALGHGSNTSRYLVNLPGNLLTATDLASYAENIAEKHGMEIKVFDKEGIEKLGMGALLAVNQGSEEPPRFIVMKYQGKDDWESPIALVGKGITFDTGGYSLKGKEGIIGMKMDMGGAAAVLGAMDAIGETKPEENVMCLIPSTDNMISGSAFKPDDVIVSMSGKTIEVRNTDAEGRLALADAVTYARQNGAAKIIDVATLTGGVVVALGDEMTGAMTNSGEWYDQVYEASEQTGELLWELPYHDVFKKKVRTSHIADLNNSPGRKGHAVLAGCFVGEFAEDTPWVHLDIAGTAITESEHDLGPKGPTGVMARTLAKTIMNQNY
ncbi:leucyl aminopeptidase [Tenuibacillus multivorans]|uniref:Probable cytosol aminopeptidase n=1 Tax=Tenuibacillus multivorans TaxID=237069 RepID=A0A1H0FT50_9BACI|nr:leucyl aminopeptidase [Tenuibacillus multivorans]GEL77898.1 putative cytosol aminopeptidase [Tenuibacillus multivorans]SDN97669.1 leucyl aminopeptidase [Tenuibacillus multivorans]